MIDFVGSTTGKSIYLKTLFEINRVYITLMLFMKL